MQVLPLWLHLYPLAINWDFDAIVFEATNQSYHQYCLLLLVCNVYFLHIFGMGCLSLTVVGLIRQLSACFVMLYPTGICCA